MRRFAGAAARICAVLAVLVLLVGVVGRIASDRWLWSQYVFWVPEELYLSGAGALCALGWFAGLIARKRPRLLRLVTLGCGLGAVHLGLIHWRLDNWIGGTRPGGLRIMNWNVTSIERDGQVSVPLLGDTADVAVLVNPINSVHWNQIIAGYPEPKFLIRESGFVILSHVPILRHGSVSLGIQGAMSESFREETRQPDPGEAMFVELDSTARLGRTTTIWVIDLPSDRRKSRWEMAGTAAAAIAAWTGPEVVHRADGLVRRGADQKGFPAPDLIMGDFNSPRGAASMGRIVGGMTDAFDQGGHGYAATWPGYGYHMPFPVLHLDHVFVAPWLRATRYEIIKPLFCYHRPQVVEIEARGR